MNKNNTVSGSARSRLGEHPLQLTGGSHPLHFERLPMPLFAGGEYRVISTLIEAAGKTVLATTLHHSSKQTVTAIASEQAADVRLACVSCLQ